jgi:hypothetical protein
MFANRKTRTLLIAFVGAVSLTAPAQESPSGLSSHPMIGEKAPVFDLEKVGGGSLDLEGLRGRYVVIHFGTSW